MKKTTLLSLLLLSGLLCACAAQTASLAPPDHRGTPVPPAQILADLRARAQAGDAAAETDLGRFYERGLGIRRDYAAAKRWYEKAAAQGNAEAQLRLGILYDLGEGVGANAVEALKWYKASAEQGNARAQIRLGDLYAGEADAAAFAARGKPSPSNYLATLPDYRFEALRWYRRAAEQGNAEGQATLAAYYARDPHTREEAYFWYSLAAGSDAHYARARDKVATKLSAARLATMQERLREWQAAHPVPNASPAAR